MNTLTSPTRNSRVADRDETVEQLITRVLRRAHQVMEGLATANEARAILHVAHSFADELAALDGRFDRLQFVKGVTSG